MLFTYSVLFGFGKQKFDWLVLLSSGRTVTLLRSVTTSSMGGCIRELYSEWLLFIKLQCHAQNSITWGCRRIFSRKLFWLALEIDWNPFWRCNLISVCLGIFWRFSLYKVHNMASMRIFLWKSRYFAWRHSISKVSSRNSKMKLLWAEYTAPSKASTQHRHDQVWLLLNDCWTSFPIIIRLRDFKNSPLNNSVWR